MKKYFLCLTVTMLSLFSCSEKNKPNSEIVDMLEIYDSLSKEYPNLKLEIEKIDGKIQGTYSSASYEGMIK